MAGMATAPSASAAGRARASPARRVRRCVKNRSDAGIRQMGEPECHRVAPRGKSKLVHEAFDRKDVAVRTKRAQRARPQRHLSEQVIDNPLPWEVVEGHRVAIAIAEGLRDLRRRREVMTLAEVPGAEEIEAACLTRP